MRLWNEPELIKRIRREVRDLDDCEIVWIPRLRHVAQVVSDDGHPLGHRATGQIGGWALCCMTHVPFVVDFHGTKIISTQVVPIPIFGLTGKYGNPRRPGDWMIYALLDKDQHMRGMDVAKELNEWEQEDIRLRHKMGRTLTRDVARDGDTFRAFQSFIDEHGRPESSKEERIADGKALEKRADQSYLAEIQELKENNFA